jgi:hypothetical protein
LELVSNISTIDRTDVHILGRPGATRVLAEASLERLVETTPTNVNSVKQEVGIQVFWLKVPTIYQYSWIRQTGTLSQRRRDKITSCQSGHCGQGPASDHESPKMQAVSPSQGMKLKWTHSKASLTFQTERTAGKHFTQDFAEFARG